MNNADKISSVLSGFSPFVRPQAAPAAPPVNPSAPPRTVAPRVQPKTAAKIPFYIASRNYKRDVSDIAKTEQAAAAKYHAEVEAERHSMPEPLPFTGSITTMGTPISQLATGKDHAARIQFVDWLKTDQPAIYEMLVSRLENGPMNAAETEKVPLWQRLTESLTGLITGVAAAKAQKEILALNLERAQQGLPPVDAESMAPVVRTQVTVTPEMAADLRAGAFNVGKVGLIAAAAAAAYFILKK